MALLATAVQPMTVTSTIVNRYQCLKYCQEESRCKWISYSPEAYDCFLLPSCATLDTSEDYISGEVDCPIEAPTGTCSKGCYNSCLKVLTYGSLGTLRDPTILGSICVTGSLRLRNIISERSEWLQSHLLSYLSVLHQCCKSSL